MRINRVHAVTVILIAQLTPSFVSSAPVSMYVKMEATSINFVYINFYNDTFQRMYNCMADMYTTQCNAKYEYQNALKPYPSDINLKVINVTFTRSSLAPGYFTCQNDQSANKLVCIKNEGQCLGNVCTSFRLSNSSMCECVYLMWNNKGEELLYDKTDNIEDCKVACTATTLMTTDDITGPSSYSRKISTQPSEVASDATAKYSNATNIANSGNDRSSSNSVPIIIGVVVGVLVIATITVLAIIYRRKKQTQKTASNDIFPRTDYNRSPVKTGTTTTNIPDVLTSLPYIHGNTRGDSEDGYYTIDKDNGLNRYENGLNTVSSKKSDHPERNILNSCDLNRYTNEMRFSPQVFQVHEGDVNSDLPPTREGDYFTIEAENDESEDTTESYEKDNTGEYSLAKDVTTIDVNIIDVIDVSSPPKTIYSKFGQNDPDVRNPYDVLLQKHEILIQEKTDDIPLQGTTEDNTYRADTSIKLSVGSGGSSAAFKTSDMTRNVDTAGSVFPQYSVVSKLDNDQ